MIQEHLSALIASNSLEEVWSLHTAKMAEFGFDRIVYGYTRFRTGTTLGDLQDALILTNHDAAYVEHFVGDGAYYQGPMVAWAAENVGACSWRMMQELAMTGKLSPGEMEVVALNQRLDVTAGYTVSFHDVSMRAKGATGLTARRGLSQDDVDAVWDKYGDDLELANKVMHLKVTQLPHTTGQRRPLTARQREVLEWVADGKTIQDTATIMGLNPATIEKHLRLARETLDVDTTAQAILKASSQNQFFLIENSS
ncbi:LuxR family transcriptional regulator [Litoreibacter halocynthiae]|uniref:LuxR family transcriptional regulator n=1 Tax=Litoreibacter halocynthiae TaxID=1242689 RepID=A0A4V3EYP2_9RHOB|nr:LuxR family transcriptional regulator [Litoreibacter halocynthiae]TDT77835.1 LuxR family transcriptional regulator [Litoreibacter halocynthiae]